MKKRTTILMSTILFLSILLAGCSSQQSAESSTAKNNGGNFPERQVEIIVGAPAGGGTDMITRAVADYLSKEWEQPVSVVNKPGAGGAMASQEVLQGKNDGYTALTDSQSNTSLLSAIMSNPPVKLEDHTWVARYAKDPVAFLVKEDAPWKDLKEFSEWAKENPKELTWTNTGTTGSSAFAVAEWIEAIEGDFEKTKMVPSEGAADAATKVAGGHAILLTGAIPNFSSLIEAGKLRILGIQAEERSPYFPDVPTFKENGIEVRTLENWAGISLPPGTPEEVVKKWEESIKKMQEDPAFLEKFDSMKISTGYLNSSDYKAFVEEESKHFEELATEYGLRK